MNELSFSCRLPGLGREALDWSTQGDDWCVCLIKEADPRGERNKGLPVFTFSRVEFWVNVSRLSPPAIDRPTEEP